MTRRIEKAMKKQRAKTESQRKMKKTSLKMIAKQKKKRNEMKRRSCRGNGKSGRSASKGRRS